MMSHQKRRALILVGHGSHLSPDTAAPVFAHVNQIRKLKLFDEVVAAFWKEEPSCRDVIRAVNAHELVVVPLFISEGYFTVQVLPRELGLATRGRVGATFAAAPVAEWVDGKRVIYTPPVGTHPAMTDVLEQRAREIVREEAVLPQECALIIVGHGTLRHSKSSESIYKQVEILRKKGLYGEVAAIFMDEPPFVNQVLTVCNAPDLIIVPYFISDGFHTQQDIPEQLGIAHEGSYVGNRKRSYSVPATLENRRLWYTGAVGTDSAVVEVILARAEEALAAVGEESWPLSSP